MRIESKISFLLAVLLLLLALPTVALAQTPVDKPLAPEKAADIQVELALETKDTQTIEPQSLTGAQRISTVFPDGALARVIADAFGVAPNSFVTQRDLDRVIAFSANDRGISNLAGMQHLTNLREVNLNDNRITDLSPLAGLVYLERLLLDDNQVQNLAPLARLVRLEWLWLDHNRITSIDALRGLNALSWLTLWGNQVRDIRPLAGLTQLESLWLADNRIENIDALRGLVHLETLSLANNHIFDLRPLANMSRMDLLWVGRQEITLTQHLMADPLAIPIAVRYPQGGFVSPNEISHGGVYNSPNLEFSNLAPNTQSIRYTFQTEVTVGRASEPFLGQVTQPLSQTPFHDVPHGAWFYNGIAFVFQHGLMSGVSNTAFAPANQLNRTMVVTVLHRLAGTPEIAFAPVFRDVAEDRWYSQAAIWAHNAGIVQGHGAPDLFAGDQAITREQFALMLYRFADSQGAEVSVSDAFTLANFSDAKRVSSWAYDAMTWAVYQGIITGTAAQTLNPQGGATRAECAVIVMRYVGIFE